MRLVIELLPCRTCGRAKFYHEFKGIGRCAYVACKCGARSDSFLFEAGRMGHIPAEERAAMRWNSMQHRG